MPTKIDNYNIKDLVKTYINNPKKLPSDLKRDYIGEWDVSNVTDMSGLFMDCDNFDEPLDDWDVSNVTDMSYMFDGCKKFNRPLDEWDVSNVTDMSYMFSGCHKFDQPLNKWKVSKVEKMDYMFAGCEKFNRPLDKWDVSNVEDMGIMFHSCKNFNQDLSSWDVYNVKDMTRMFESCGLKINPKWIINPETETEYMFRATRLEGTYLEVSDINIRKADNEVKNTIMALSERRNKNNENVPLIPELTRHVISYIDPNKITDTSKALEAEHNKLNKSIKKRSIN